VDTLAAPGGSVIGYQSLVPISTGVNQTYDTRTSGGYNEIALGFAGNMADKLYVGGSFTIPIVRYHRELFYSERDASTNPSNEFSFFEYRETFTSNGIGIGAKLGAIYKPVEYVRLGFAFHTPQLMSYVDKIRSSMITNTENYAGLRTESSDALNNGNAGERRYNLTTPWRMIASASYVFREIKDTRRQRAFLSADIEYVNYRAARFQASSEGIANNSLVDYYNNLNSAIKETYKGNINVKVGGELKFNTFMVRAGGAYYGSPYADDAIKASRTVISGGLGYRNKGMFIDLTYSHNLNRDAVFAYRLADKANTFANQTGSAGNLMLTVGFKL
jgi:long-subunit fatty acid transport protein